MKRTILASLIVGVVALALGLTADSASAARRP